MYGQSPMDDGHTEIKVALTGNPNVGKSTVFNALTGMRQHTGNWSGKTVETAVGICKTDFAKLVLTDLPGCYSLDPHSAEEAVTRDHLLSGDSDIAVVVCDASLLERNLILALQVMAISPRTVIVLNLMDEAEKKGIAVDSDIVAREMGVPVIPAAARSGRGIEDIPQVITDEMAKPPRDAETPTDPVAEAERIAALAVNQSGKGLKNAFDRRMDRILTGRFTAMPVMFLLVCAVMWITVKGANYPSAALSEFFGTVGDHLRRLLTDIGAPAVLISCLVDGVYLVTSWVVSVMLPPMAIFFPLFTLLEDLGYLPRVAFNLDRFFKGCGSCGKQALTMCMGLGCNAAGVVGCRIIDSKRERRIAVLTNSLVPCNGKFPAVICLVSVFFASSGFGAAMGLTLVVVIGVGMTLLVSRILSKTALRGMASSFALELPPYRIPKVGSVIVRSVFDRTLFVLGRAVSVAAPAGFIIWLLANVTVDGGTLLQQVAKFLDPAGRFLGMDGVILTAFILALPANEIVLPLAAMGYMASGTLAEMGTAEMGAVLRSFGWDTWTAAAVIGFALFHWPCSTTLATVKKETGSVKTTIFAALIPTVCGVAVCLLLRLAKWLITVWI